MHPFSDQSGVTFFNTQTTVISSVPVPMHVLQDWLQAPEQLGYDESKALQALIDQGFVVETATNRE